jgi:hypothetical protein
MFRTPNYYQKKNTGETLLISSVGSLPSKFVKSLRFIGLVADTVKQRIYSTEDTVLNITPRVYNPDQNNPPGLYFDFNSPSKPTEKSRSDLVANFFGKLGINNQTLTVTKSEYDYNSCSLNGSYTFMWFENNIVYLQGLTLTNYDSSKSIYYSEKFSETPVFTLADSPPYNEIAIPLPAGQIRIVNRLPSGTNSFITQGIIPRDIIEFGEDKFRVLDLYLNPKTKQEELILDEKEFLVKDGKAVLTSEIDDPDVVYMFNLYKQI